MAPASQVYALFVGGERRFETEISGLESLDDCLELHEELVEAEVITLDFRARVHGAGFLPRGPARSMRTPGMKTCTRPISLTSG